MSTDTVKIKVTLLGRTPLAIYINDGRRDVWLPLSQVEEEIKEPGAMGIPTTTTIVVKDWVAKEKGLLQLQEDDCTMDMFGGSP